MIFDDVGHVGQAQGVAIDGRRHAVVTRLDRHAGQIVGLGDR